MWPWSFPDTVTVCAPFSSLSSSSSSLFLSPHLCPTHDCCSLYRITITDQWGLTSPVRWVLSAIIILILILTFLLSPPLRGHPFAACHLLYSHFFIFLFSERCMGKHTPISGGACVFASVFEPFWSWCKFLFIYWWGYIRMCQRVWWRGDIFSGAMGLDRRSQLKCPKTWRLLLFLCRCCVRDGRRPWHPTHPQVSDVVLQNNGHCLLQTSAASTTADSQANLFVCKMSDQFHLH